MERHPVATTIVTLEVCRDGRLTIVAELASSPTSNRRVGAGIQSLSLCRLGWESAGRALSWCSAVERAPGSCRDVTAGGRGTGDGC